MCNGNGLSISFRGPSQVIYRRKKYLGVKIKQDGSHLIWKTQELKDTKGIIRFVNRRRTDNTMEQDKGQKDKQRSIKHNT